MPPLEVRIRDNEKLKCKVKSCHQNRSRVSGYCVNHNVNLMQNGSVHHRAIKRGKYKHVLEPIRKLIELNLEKQHKGVTEAVTYFDRLIQNPQDEWMERLKDKGIRGVDILVELSGVTWLYNERPDIIHTPRHYQYVLASRLLRLVPYHHPIPTRFKKYYGKLIFDRYLRLLITIRMGLEEELTIDVEPKEVCDND